jgi:hypothetical protein
MAAMCGLIHSPGGLGPKMRSSQKTRRRRAARGRGPSPSAFFRNRHKPARLAHINLNAKAIPCSLQTTANKNSPFPAALDMNEFNEETPSAPPAFAAINPCEMSHARCFFMHPNRTPSADVFRPAPGFLCRASSDRGALTRPQCSAPLTNTTCTRRVLHRIDTSRGDAGVVDVDDQLSSSAGLTYTRDASPNGACAGAAPWHPAHYTTSSPHVSDRTSPRPSHSVLPAPSIRSSTPATSPGEPACDVPCAAAGNDSLRACMSPTTLRRVTLPTARVAVGNREASWEWRQERDKGIGIAAVHSAERTQTE